MDIIDEKFIGINYFRISVFKSKKERLLMMQTIFIILI